MSSNPMIARRQRWLSVLEKPPAARLASLWQGLETRPAYTVLRRPEIGLVMMQGRISGTGAPFCAGEMTVTRAAVRLDSGEMGFGYGRDARQAEIVTPLADEAEARHRRIASRAAATRVDFFTVARETGA